MIGQSYTWEREQRKRGLIHLIQRPHVEHFIKNTGIGVETGLLRYNCQPKEGVEYLVITSDSGRKRYRISEP